MGDFELEGVFVSALIGGEDPILRVDLAHRPIEQTGRFMFRTIEAEIDEQGRVELLEPVRLPVRSRALVTILDPHKSTVNESALLSEAALSEDWNRPEEDAAWSHLQPATSS